MKNLSKSLTSSMLINATTYIYNLLSNLSIVLQYLVIIVGNDVFIYYIYRVVGMISNPGADNKVISISVFFSEPLNSSNNASGIVRPNPTWFFRFNPILGPRFKRVGLTPRVKKPGSIGSGWPQKGLKFGFNPIMYLIHPNEPYLNQTLGQNRPSGSLFM